MHANFAAVQTMAVIIFLPSSVSSKLDRQSHQLLWQAVAKSFSHIRFCTPNARWLSLLDDFVTKKLRNPCATRPCPLEQNSGDANAYSTTIFVRNASASFVICLSELSSSKYITRLLTCCFACGQRLWELSVTGHVRIAPIQPTVTIYAPQFLCKFPHA